MSFIDCLPKVTNPCHALQHLPLHTHTHYPAATTHKNNWQHNCSTFEESSSPDLEYSYADYRDSSYLVKADLGFSALFP